MKFSYHWDTSRSHIKDFSSPLQSVLGIQRLSDTLFPDSFGKYRHNQDHHHTSALNGNGYETTYPSTRHS